MTTPTWMSRARVQIDTLPPTRHGLVTALRIAEQVSLLLAQAQHQRSGDELAQPALMCAAAVGEVESTFPRRNIRSLTLQPPTDAADPKHARALAALLRECLGLANELLDNDEEPLTPADLMAIRRAMDLLEKACSSCSGVAA